MSDKNLGLFQGSGGKDHHHQGPAPKNNSAKEAETIIFRDGQNHLRKELLVKEAKDWANKIAVKVSYTQLRKFYTEALALKSRLEEKVKDKGKEEGFKEMEALIGMLISKANYSKIRSKKKGIYENEELFNFIYAGITAVHSAQDFYDFVLFFEAVLGFFPRKN